jgi:LysM repeat protein
MNTSRFLVFLLFILPLTGFGESDPGRKITRQEYINQWKDEAIRQMEKYGVPASIKLAQGILESADGNSMLARKANNHFGIKCHGWSGPGVYKDDDAKNECFRKYRNAGESFEDHSQFLLKPRYADLFRLKSTDYKGWAHGLKKAGYATNPKYPQLLITIIEENNLHQYDKAGGRRPGSEKPVRDDDGPVIDYSVGRQILETDNRARFVFAKEGDTYQRIAAELGLDGRLLKKYNDVEQGTALTAGERVYIRPKRNKSASKEIHVVQQGETLRDISQLHAVKLNRLLKYNNLTENAPLNPGKEIRLRK